MNIELTSVLINHVYLEQQTCAVQLQTCNQTNYITQLLFFTISPAFSLESLLIVLQQ